MSKRVLVVDDSPLFADVMRDMLRGGGLEVVGVACDGAQAVRMTHALQPDIVTMDVLMPVMNGLTAIEEIMATRPTPILVLSGDPRGRAGELTFEALRRGALDVMAKPERWPAPRKESDALVDRVRFLASVPVVRHLQAHRHRWQRAARVEATSSRIEAVGIVASTGGPRALSVVLGGLGEDFPLPILVVQHLAAGFTAGLCTWLARVCPLRVREADEGASLDPGTVYIAPQDRHLLVDDARRIRLDDGPPVAGHRASGTLLLRALARVHRHRALGIVLTGMGQDGAEGLLELHRAGGPTIVQDAATSIVDGMPGAARKLGAARWVTPLSEIAAVVTELTRDAAR